MYIFKVQSLDFEGSAPALLGLGPGFDSRSERTVYCIPNKVWDTLSYCYVYVGVNGL
jgi:hypothetical protein